MPKSPTATKARESRINVRVKPEQKAVIARAAHLRHTTISNFVIDHAFEAASRLIAEETQVPMTPEQFEHFCRLLDAPPARNLKAMRRLLDRPSVLDE